MQIIGLSIIFLGIIAFEAPRLMKEKMWGELAAFSGLLLLGMVLSFAAVLNIEIPSPTSLVEFLFEPLSKAIISIIE